MSGSLYYGLYWKCLSEEKRERVKKKWLACFFHFDREFRKIRSRQEVSVSDEITSPEGKSLVSSIWVPWDQYNWVVIIIFLLKMVMYIFGIYDAWSFETLQAASVHWLELTLWPVFQFSTCCRHHYQRAKFEPGLESSRVALQIREIQRRLLGGLLSPPVFKTCTHSSWSFSTRFGILLATSLKEIPFFRPWPQRDLESLLAAYILLTTLYLPIKRMTI